MPCFILAVDFLPQKLFTRGTLDPGVCGQRGETPELLLLYHCYCFAL